MEKALKTDKVTIVPLPLKLCCGPIEWMVCAPRFDPHIYNCIFDRLNEKRKLIYVRGQKADEMDWKTALEYVMMLELLMGWFPNLKLEFQWKNMFGKGMISSEDVIFELLHTLIRAISTRTHVALNQNPKEAITSFSWCLGALGFMKNFIFSKNLRFEESEDLKIERLNHYSLYMKCCIQECFIKHVYSPEKRTTCAQLAMCCANFYRELQAQVGHDNYYSKLWRKSIKFKGDLYLLLANYWMGMYFFEALDIEKGLGYFVKCMEIAPKLPKGDIIKFVTFKIKKCVEENMRSYFKKAATTVEVITPLDATEMPVHDKVESLSRVCRVIKEEFATGFKREKQHQGFQEIIKAQRLHRTRIQMKLRKFNLPHVAVEAVKPVDEIQADNIQNARTALIQLQQIVRKSLMQLQEKESLLNEFQRQKLEKLKQALVVGNEKNVELDKDCDNLIIGRHRELLIGCLDLLEKLQRFFQVEDKLFQFIINNTRITEEQHNQMLESQKEQESILALILEKYKTAQGLGICRPKSQLASELIERLHKGILYFRSFEEELKKTKIQFGL